MLKHLLLMVITLMSFSSFALAESSQCSVDKVTATAVAVGNSLYKGANFDGIKIENFRQKRIGVHLVEAYDLWLTSQGVFKTQIHVDFVVRPAGNLFYGKVGCGLISTSIPFFQAP